MPRAKSRLMCALGRILFQEFGRRTNHVHAARLINPVVRLGAAGKGHAAAICPQAARPEAVPKLPDYGPVGIPNGRIRGSRGY